MSRRRTKRNKAKGGSRARARRAPGVAQAPGTASGVHQKLGAGRSCGRAFLFAPSLARPWRPIWLPHLETRLRSSRALPSSNAQSGTARGLLLLEKLFRDVRERKGGGGGVARTPWR
eukprot:231307-Chlamydomonas_euryale.AAC.1